MKVAFVGAGNMAMALMGGMINRGIPAGSLLAIDPNHDAIKQCSERYGVLTAQAMDQALKEYDVIVLAVKPQALKAVSTSLSAVLDKQLIISIAAGIRLRDLSRWLGSYTNIVRTMPNTPALIGMGVTGLVAHADVGAQGKEMASQVLGAVGTNVWLDHEQDIDAVTAVSGSGPAYVFYFIEAMQEAAVRMGLTHEQARVLATATFCGAAQMAAGSDEAIGVLRERVTSKGGTTAAALASFDKAAISEHIIAGAISAMTRATELGDELGEG